MSIILLINSLSIKCQFLKSTSDLKIKNNEDIQLIKIHNIHHKLGYYNLSLDSIKAISNLHKLHTIILTYINDIIVLQDQTQRGIWRLTLGIC